MTILTLTVPGVRDYVHVVDLAKGHLAAMKKIDEKSGPQVCILTKLQICNFLINV